MEVDKYIHLVALKDCQDMEDEMEKAETRKDKYRVVMKYIHKISPKSAPTYWEDKYDFEDMNIYILCALGIGEYMYEKITDFANLNGIKYANL